MSRIGKQPIPIPTGVKVDLKGQEITVKGQKGSKALTLVEEVVASIEDNAISIKPRNPDRKRDRQMWGMSRTVVSNVIQGLSEGFVKNLEINGVGYRAAVKGKNLELSLGYSHPVEYPIPDGIEIKCEKPTLIQVSGADKQQVGQVAAEIRDWRRPEPFKGKGVKYADEYIFRKEGKKK